MAAIEQLADAVSDALAVQPGAGGGAQTPQDSLSRTNSDSDSGTGSALNTGGTTSPHTRTTVTTTTTSGAGDGSRGGTATTIQYSNVSSVEITGDAEKDGTVHLRPVPARKDRKVKVKRVVQFVPRISHFDRFHPTSQGDTFRGFYVLFWMLMGLTLIRTLYHSYLQSGEVVGMRFAKLITGDAIVLALSDAVLVGSTIICVPFIKVRVLPEPSPFS